jgi:hypothetical protein
MYRTCRTIIVALGLIGATWCVADDSLPAQKKYHGTTYISGGTTPAQAKALREVANTYSMQLTLMVNGAAMGAGAAKVKIIDQREDIVLDVVAEGPELYVNVPGGRYTVSVEHAGETRQKTFDLIGRRSGQFFFDFAEADADKK